MKYHLVLTGCACLLTACSTPYHPLADPELRPVAGSSGPGVHVTFLGNTNFLISDGETHLLVDGFFTRPSALKTFFGRIQPDREIIARELKRAGITRLNGILVGHAHHDHALDTPEVARQLGHVPVMGSASYAKIHEGQGGLIDPGHLTIVPSNGGWQDFGRFRVHFTPSRHVGSHNLAQYLIEGEIKRPLKVPAYFTRFKCGQVYALHIHHHDHGDIGITTTSGAEPDQWSNKKANVVFLSVGFLSKESHDKRRDYWTSTVGALEPSLVVPVHWDNFSKPLSEGLQPAPRIVDNVRSNLAWVKKRAHCEKRDIRVLAYGESIRLMNKQVR